MLFHHLPQVTPTSVTLPWVPAELDVSPGRGPTELSCRYLCQMSTVSPAVALQGTSGDTMLWFTRADR